MAEAKQCVILGGGGHARVLIDTMRLSGVAIPQAVLDSHRTLWGNELLGVPIVGGDDLIPGLIRQGIRYFVVGLGGIGDNRPRHQLFDVALKHGLTPLTIFHPTAVCSSWAKIGAGSVIFPNAVVNAGAALGVNVIVNTGAIIEHDCVIGDHAHVATGAHLASTVQIGTSAHIGVGATVRQFISIGEGAVVGAGAVVIHDVSPWTVVVGVPAHRLRAVQPFLKPSRTQRILFLGKAGDEWCTRAAEYLKLLAPKAEISMGRRGDPFPPIDPTAEFDYVISYLCPWVVPEELLKRARYAAINFHPGPPEYPGIGCTNFALYEGALTYGVMCHHMERVPDTGPIIRTIRFPVYNTDTVLSLTHRCYAYIARLFYEIADLMLTGQPLPMSSERWTRRPFRRAELNALCRVTSDMTQEEIQRRVRATTFPGHASASPESLGTLLQVEDI